MTSAGTASQVAATMRIMSGSTTTVWTRITPGIVCARPKRMKKAPSPVASTTPGIMIGVSTKSSSAGR